MNETTRCHWCESHPLLTEYHDHEWGVPIVGQVHLFEHFILEIFQAGLNWLTMLKKRENFRAAFSGFDPEKIARYSDNNIEELLGNAGIIRNRSKIQAAINNAGAFLNIADEFDGFWDFVKQFKPETEIIFRTEAEIPATTKESAAMAAELKSRGFKFIGPVSAYAYMQGVGIVNDHVETCFRFREINRLRSGKF
ncbi:MAG: DNA-3-methyladenine glycosylase I [FCB group bacterium]|nr:DNA-3-methyladenine glycosylase I [FCB group bacterium]